MSTLVESHFPPMHGPALWGAASFKSKADFSRRMPQALVDELRRFAARWKADGRALTDITLEEDGTPALKAFMSEVRGELWDGRGLLVLQGLPVQDVSIEEVEAYYWLLSLHLGKPVSQSAAGERIARVQDRARPGESSGSRGYTSRRQLPLHTDNGDYMGLLCIRAAKSGGLSLAVSVPTVYNQLRESAPASLDRLFRGFPFHRRQEQQDGEPVVTPYDVPVLGWAGRRICSLYVRPSIELAYRELGREMNAKDVEALDAFDDACWSDRNLVQFMLEPGDIYYANNLSTLHSRTEFEDFDDDERRRLSLRIWLQQEPRTPIPITQVVYRNPSLDLGIDEKAGGKPASADYLVEFKRKTA